MDVPIHIWGFIISLFNAVQCPYPPTGEEVQMGSVLLPATRRGRYLANIVRRQAVDGTGIKFNKDADRMNAEAKKKVDVLSDELLPYIIAEQERRTTLYKRVMTAIQNGEKGITIAEIRNKPPLLIKRGLMYRCPANRAPKEPDGSGTLLCDDDVEPTQIIYDSCLSAEDKDLYVAENKYFFCNRKKVEGPDLPRNGTTPIGCAPIERTSYNYTTSKCSLEDTDDVVVHYRYYPDRTYKYVTELDPDREVCDHWNPCQIGYIYSLPGTDQAIPANELWPEYVERSDEFEKDEIIQPIAEDSPNEFLSPSATTYTSSPRRVAVPPGFNYTDVSLGGDTRKSVKFEVNVVFLPGNIVLLSLVVAVAQLFNFGAMCSFAAVFADPSGQTRKKSFLNLAKSSITVTPINKISMPGRPLDKVTVTFTCNGCSLQRILLRTLENVDNSIQYLDGSRYEIQGNQLIVGSDKVLTPRDFGDYFGVFRNKEGSEERVKVLTVIAPVPDTENLFKTNPISTNIKSGGHYEATLAYACDDCEIMDLQCNGESIMNQGRVTVVPESKMISFNFPRFEDFHACVYLVLFKKNDKTMQKTIAVLENASPGVTIPNLQTIAAPSEGSQFILDIPFTGDVSSVSKVTVNGIELVPSGKPTEGITAMYQVDDKVIRVKISEFSKMFEGTYQATFIVDEPITKTILVIVGEESTPASTAPDAVPTIIHDDQDPIDGHEESTPASTAPDAVPTIIHDDQDHIEGHEVSEFAAPPADDTSPKDDVDSLKEKNDTNAKKKHIPITERTKMNHF